MNDESFNEHLLNNSNFLYHFLYSGRFHSRELGILGAHSAGCKLVDYTTTNRWYDVWAEILISAKSVLTE